MAWTLEKREGAAVGDRSMGRGEPQFVEATAEQGCRVVGRIRDAKSRRYGDLAAHGKGSSEIDDVLASAHEGRIDTLFLRAGDDLWGTFDLAGRAVETADEPGPGAVELYDLAADPSQKNDLAAQRPEAVRELVEQLKIVSARDNDARVK